ncbi:MAG TPA: ATP-grasp domain-containing protein [Gemmataceae bacterium]|jgi:D-alanine-D-alanine ligase
MRIGITYDLKTDTSPRPDQPDDFQEEFDSPVTIEAIAAVLRAADHEVIKLGDGRELLKRLLADPPDFVFNIAEGEGVGRSREARVPAVLEMLGIPYTGSDPLTLAVTLDKDCAKRLVASAGVAVPKNCLVTPNRKCQSYAGPFPAIVKPAWEGSSKGIRNCCVVDRAEDLPSVIESLRRDHRQPVMVEEFIPGDEVTVGVLGDGPPRILGVMRVLPRQPTERFVYSLEVKRDFRNQVRYECPPKLPAPQVKAIEGAALNAYEVLGCRDVARVDFRVRDGVPYFLELNPLPGLNPESSDLVILAEIVGWTYGQLIESILDAAIARQKK